MIIKFHDNFVKKSLLNPVGYDIINKEYFYCNGGVLYYDTFRPNRNGMYSVQEYYLW